MGQVSATVNGRTYRLSCEDGQEARLREIADYISEKMQSVTSEFGQVGEDRVLLMAAIMVCDELFDLRAEVAANTGAAASALRSAAASSGGEADAAVAGGSKKRQAS